MTWQRKKGTHYIRAKAGLLPLRCIHYINYPFTVHREADVDNETNKAKEGKLWAITHMPSGYSIGHTRRLLKNAKALADELRRWNEFYLMEPNTALSSETKAEIMKVLNTKHLDYQIGH